MTPQVIAELRALTHGCGGTLPPCECDIPDGLGAEKKADRREPVKMLLLDRLLDEREELIKAIDYAYLNERKMMLERQELREYLLAVVVKVTS